MSAPPAVASVVTVMVVAAGVIGGAWLSSTHAPDDVTVAPAGQRVAALFTAEGGPVVPGAPPRGLNSSSAGECASCHAEIAAEWASSGHARSWSDPIFQAEYRLTGQAFCRHCHAPLAAETTDEDVSMHRAGSARADDGNADPRARGIDCAVCHVRSGHVLGAGGRGGRGHATLRDARLATSAFCGGCHQFNFPARAGAQVRYHPGRPLQNTVVEWQQSRYADRPCQACHMPLVGAPGRAHRSHAFRTLDDPELMARAVRVTADARRRGPAVDITIEIAAAEIGHAFPTGDMFRQAVLTVRAGAARRQELLMRYFAQTITDDASGHLLGQVDDTRVPPPGAGPAPRFELALDEPSATEVVWSLELFRLAPDDARARGLDMSEIRVPVQSGRIAIRN